MAGKQREPRGDNFTFWIGMPAQKLGEGGYYAKSDMELESGGR